MKKLNDKIKFKLVDGHAELFAKHLESGEFRRFATCHLSVLDLIRNQGLKAAMDLGCVRFI